MYQNDMEQLKALEDARKKTEPKSNPSEWTNYKRGDSNFDLDRRDKPIVKPLRKPHGVGNQVQLPPSPSSRPPVSVRPIPMEYSPQNNYIPHAQAQWQQQQLLGYGSSPNVTFNQFQQKNMANAAMYGQYQRNQILSPKTVSPPPPPSTSACAGDSNSILCQREQEFQSMATVFILQDKKTWIEKAGPGLVRFVFDSRPFAFRLVIRPGTSEEFECKLKPRIRTKGPRTYIVHAAAVCVYIDFVTHTLSFCFRSVVSL